MTAHLSPEDRDELQRLRTAIEALADDIDRQRDELRESYRRHNVRRDLSKRPPVRPDLRTWGDAYEVAGRRVRELLSNPET